MSNSNGNKQFDVASLHKVRPEIESTLKTLEHNLGDFVDDASTNYLLSESAETLEQVRSVLSLIQLDGSSELLTALVKALNTLAASADNTNRELIYSISEGVMTLNRYIEFVLLKERLYPQLLIKAVNSIHKEIGEPLLEDANSFSTPSAKPSVPSPEFNSVAEKAEDAAKFLQQTFRHGLNEALKSHTDNNSAAFQKIKLMHAACKKAQDVVGGNFWDVATKAVAELEKELPLNAENQKNLAFIERQFTQSATQVDTAKFSNLYYMSVGYDESAVVDTPTQTSVDNEEYQKMHDFMYGPNKEVVDTVNELIQEEINTCKDMIDTEARKDQPDPENCKEIALALRSLSLRLYTLGLSSAAEKVMEQAKVVSGWQSADPEQFEQLLSALLYAENATILMAKSHTPGLVSLPLNNTGISLHQLDTAFDELVKESRSTLANAVASLTSYMGSENKDFLHIANLPTMLSSVGGALLFVDVSKGHKLLDHAAKYVDKKVKSESHFSEEQLAKLGDIIMSADFYLESIEQKQPSGDSPLIIGARSLKSLLTAA